MELGDHIVAMDKTQGITKVHSTTGPVLLKAYQTIRVTKESVSPSESLVNPDQLRCIGIQVHDTPRTAMEGSNAWSSHRRRART